MSKKEQKKKIELIGATILDQFGNHITRHRKISDIVEFLYVQDAILDRLLGPNGKPEDLPEETKEQIVEFSEYFLSEFDDITYDARHEIWGEDDALILNVADALLAELMEKEYNEEYAKLSDAMKKEADTLTDAIFNVREDRLITAAYNTDEGWHSASIELPRTIYRDLLKWYRISLACLVFSVINGHGALMIRENRKNGDIVLYGYRMVNVIGDYMMWSPIPADEFQASHLTTPSGIMLEPEDNVSYICKERENF